MRLRSSVGAAGCLVGVCAVCVLCAVCVRLVTVSERVPRPLIGCRCVRRLVFGVCLVFDRLSDVLAVSILDPFCNAVEGVLTASFFYPRKISTARGDTLKSLLYTCRNDPRIDSDVRRAGRLVVWCWFCAGLGGLGWSSELIRSPSRRDQRRSVVQNYRITYRCLYVRTHEPINSPKDSPRISRVRCQLRTFKVPLSDFCIICISILHYYTSIKANSQQE